MAKLLLIALLAGLWVYSYTDFLDGKLKVHAVGKFNQTIKPGPAKSAHIGTDRMIVVDDFRQRKNEVVFYRLSYCPYQKAYVGKIVNSLKGRPVTFREVYTDKGQGSVSRYYEDTRTKANSSYGTMINNKLIPYWDEKYAAQKIISSIEY